MRRSPGRRPSPPRLRRRHGRSPAVREGRPCTRNGRSCRTQIAGVRTAQARIRTSTDASAKIRARPASSRPRDFLLDLPVRRTAQELVRLYLPGYIHGRQFQGPRVARSGRAGAVEGLASGIRILPVATRRPPGCLERRGLRFSGTPLVPLRGFEPRFPDQKLPEGLRLVAAVVLFGSLEPLSPIIGLTFSAVFDPLLDPTLTRNHTSSADIGRADAPR